MKTNKLTQVKTSVKEQVSAQVVIASIEKKSKKLITNLEALAILKTTQDFEKAGELLKELKSYSKEAATQEASIVDPIKTALKNTQALFKPFQVKCSAIESTIKQSMLQFLEAQKSKEKILVKKLEAGEIKRVSTFIDKIEELKVSNTSVSQRVIKKLYITDESIIPREYLVPDTAAITKALKEGKKVKGCEFRDEVSLAV